MAIWAAAGPMSIEGTILQTGVIGALFLGLVFWAKKQIDEKDARINRLEEDKQRFYDA